MGRPIRYQPRPNTLFEVSTRTIQERFLLKPAKPLNELLLGVLGRALHQNPEIKLHAFGILSNHYHLLLTAPDTAKLACFMNHFNSNVAREAGRFYEWRDKFWSRRYRALPILDEEEAWKRLKYVFSHGVKEGLVERVEDWPGPNCFRALAYGEKLEGAWVERGRYYTARRSKKDVTESDFTTRYEIPFAPLPALEDLPEEQRRERIHALVQEIEEEARAKRGMEDRSVLGVSEILNSNPEAKPFRRNKTPAPLCLSKYWLNREIFRFCYRTFIQEYREAAKRYRAGEPKVRFPEYCFPPHGSFVYPEPSPAPA